MFCCQPEPRVLLGDNRGAGRAELLVGAGLLGMPVRVEERPHRAAIGQRGHRLRQRGGVLRESAVHHHDAVGAGARDHVAARAAEQKEIVAQVAWSRSSRSALRGNA